MAYYSALVNLTFRERFPDTDLQMNRLALFDTHLKTPDMSALIDMNWNTKGNTI